MEKKVKEELKALGLQGLEDLSKGTVETLFKAIEIIVKNTENKMDDAFLPFLALIKEKIILLIEQIKQDKV